MTVNDMIATINFPVFPWEVSVLVRGVFFSLTVLLIKRSFRVREWVTFWLSTTLLVGWLFKIPHRFVTEQPVYFGELIHYISTGILILTVHLILVAMEQEPNCPPEEQKEPCPDGEAAVSSVPAEQ